MNINHSERAKQYMTEADGHMKYKDEYALESAASLYRKAGFEFKLNKDYELAIKAYENSNKAYSTFLDGKSLELANNFEDIAKIYDIINHPDCIEVYKTVLGLYQEHSKYMYATNIMEKIISLYENSNDFEKTIPYYTDLIQYYEMMQKPTHAIIRKQSMANTLVLLGRYAEARNLYIEVAKGSSAFELMKFSVKNNFFMVGLCNILIKDTVALNNTLDECTALQPYFKLTLEYECLKKFIVAYMTSSITDFNEGVHRYTSVTPLNTFMKEVFSKVRTVIQN